MDTVHKGLFLSFRKVLYSTSDGETLDREYVVHPGAVVIVPVTSSGDVLAVTQFRAALGREILELPAGKRDVIGEAVADTAARELEEELGVVAGSYVHLGTFYNSPGFCDEESHVFLALGLSVGRRSPQSIEERLSRLCSFQLQSVDEMRGSGVLEDAKTLLGISWAKGYLESEEGMKLLSGLEDNLDLTAFPSWSF